MYNLATIQEVASFDGDLNDFLVNNTQYSKKAQKMSIEGIVKVKFVIEKDGSLSNIEIKKPVHKLLDSEALRVVNKMQGKWKAGNHNGKPVRMSFVLPFVFKFE